MARKQRGQDTEERTRSKHRYSTGRGSSSDSGSDGETAGRGGEDARGSDMDRRSEVSGRGTARPHEEGVAGGFYEGEDLNEASIEDLREFADELQIEDYESMSRADLVREIRNQTQARP